MNMKNYIRQNIMMNIMNIESIIYNKYNINSAKCKGLYVYLYY